MAGGLDWNVAAVITIVGWLVSPIIGFLLPKILSRIGFEVGLEQKIQHDLEYRIIPDLEKTLHAVDTERLMKRREKAMSVVDKLDKMAAGLREARDDADDILDDAPHKIVVGDILYWRCLGIARIIQKGSARLQSLLCRFLGRPDLETLKADLKKISSELHALLTDDDEAFYRLSQVDRMRMIPKTLRGNMMKMIPQLVRLRPEETAAMECGFLNMMNAWLVPAQEEEDGIDVAQEEGEGIDDAQPEEEGIEEEDIDDAQLEEEDIDGAQLEEEDIYDAQEEGEGIDDAQLEEEDTCDAQKEGEDIDDAQLEEEDIYDAQKEGEGIHDAQEEGEGIDDAQDEGEEIDDAHVEEEEIDDAHVEEEEVDHAHVDEEDIHDAQPEEWEGIDDAQPEEGEGIDDAQEEGEGIDGARAEDNVDDYTNCFDKMVELLRRAEEEDIHDAQHDIGSHASSWPHHLYGAVEACIARRKRSCIGIARSRSSSRLLQWAQNFSRWFLRRSEYGALPTTTMDTAAPSDSLGIFKTCCIPLFHLLVHVYEVACTHRDRSYRQVFGITSNYQEHANLLDFVLTAISRRNLSKRKQRVERSISEVNASPLLVGASKSTLEQIANKNRSGIRTATKRKVFGLEDLRDDIIGRLHETPNSTSTSSCYSVIGIYGVAGSGKTTLARYIRDCIKCTELFDTIMCLHVSEAFSVDAIFNEMLKDITKNRHSYISDREELEEKLKKSLRGKRFFLILDDLWVKNKNDPQLVEVISPLSVGMKGSKILVTARTKDAARALCADEPIKMPDLDEEQYFEMFMHYALGGKSVDVKKFEPVGREIANKLRRSPIAAAIVAGQLGTNPSILFWENTLELDMLNDTMDALWWSYQQLNQDIRRCLEYCNIFPNRFKMEKNILVHLWIAEGLVTGSAREDMERVAEDYIQGLVSHSFLEAEGTDLFSVHDLLRDLLDKVAGCDYYKILNARSQSGESCNGVVNPDVRHLFVQSYDAELITKKILGLENLRTLIIDFAGSDVEEKLIESLCKRLSKLRVLAIALSNRDHGVINYTKKFLFPESIRQLKHLRYLAFRTLHMGMVVLPSALTKLDHIQLLDFGDNVIEFPSTGVIKLRHIICRYDAKVPNIGRFKSLQTLQNFQVRNEEGYEVKQLMDLDKLCGSLAIHGLENVKSKREALEANLATKKWLKELKLFWTGGCTRRSPEVEEEVLEGLCTSVELERLEIFGYEGSKYPDWMVVSNQRGDQKKLQRLMFVGCSNPVSAGPPALEAFPRLRSLFILHCSWDSLPGNLEHLTSLKTLLILNCKNLLSLPTLPQHLEEIIIELCDEGFMESCVTVGHPNWQKIQHIPNIHIPN